MRFQYPISNQTIWYSFDIHQMPPSKTKIWLVFAKIMTFEYNCLIFTKCARREREVRLPGGDGAPVYPDVSGVMGPVEISALVCFLLNSCLNIQCQAIWYLFDIRQCPPPKLRFGMFCKSHEIWQLAHKGCCSMYCKLEWVKGVESLQAEWRFEYPVANHLIFIWYSPNAPLKN